MTGNSGGVDSSRTATLVAPLAALVATVVLGMGVAPASKPEAGQATAGESKPARDRSSRSGLLTPRSREASVVAEKAAEPSLADELPRLPPMEPKEALAAFELQRGFSLELAAAEPEVMDPVDACFDENGRMFVAEFHGYPYSAEKRDQDPTGRGKKESGIIRLLEDVDGDGRFERSTVFADKLDWPLSVCCYAGGVFVIDPPHLLYLKDTDGDNRADVKEAVYSGFSRANVQGLANNLKWGLDNRIWAASGSNAGTLTHRGKPLFALGRRDWVFDPKTEKLEAASGGIQFGHSMDDWGNRFLCSNSNHMMHVVFEEKYVSRNPYFAPPSAVRTVAKEGGAAPVFRKSPAEPWRIVRTRRRVSDPKYAHLPPTERVPIGFFTSATGVTIYRGDAYPEEYRGNAFIGDVGGNLVHRKTVAPNGATFVSERADQNVEFLTSTDTWFRPVNFVNAPDGTLFVLDMYRETIEHPISIPEDIKAHLDLESGDDRGRIYRLVSPGMKRATPPRLGSASVAELVANLASSNAWNRQTAQRLLWERQEKEAIPAVAELCRSSKSPLGRLHALYTLGGLGALTPELVIAGMKDAHPGVREHAAKLSEPLLASNPAVADALIALAFDAEYRPRFQAILSLGYVPGEQGVAGLTRVAKTLDGKDADLQAAFLTSVNEPAAPIAAELLHDAEFLRQPGAKPLAGTLARIVGARPSDADAVRLLAAALRDGVPADVRPFVLHALGEGLARRGATLAKLLAADGNDAVRAQAQALFVAATATAGDEKRETGARKEAIGLLAFADVATAAPTLEGLLSPQTPQELQSAAVAALAAHDDPQVATTLIEAWRGFGPKVRNEATDALLARLPRIESLLAALADGRVKRGEIDRDKKQLLINHPNDAVRNRARELFSGELAGNRAKVVAEYQPALELAGEAARGKEIFAKKCSVCHKLGNEGHPVGPDLTSTQNKSPADLLIAILDPNREAQANFTAYTVVTLDGRIVTGIVSAESAGSVTLRRAEGKEDTVLRSQIDTLSSNGLSLMPEGLEKELDRQQVADVIAFVKSLKPSK